ncbi:hypothetical protein Hypma_007318 [Hypsizygus marmoreus]|uniref:Required for respiratory growth protein 7, mitochondrial n=1 Tax=Hypsizygus marmoreus TaxID=39966 RepID=A0A369K755_HYPMA|nr:hypothetical protein Hypma_007318 [Hypsizygus marmoreus]
MQPSLPPTTMSLHRCSRLGTRLFTTSSSARTSSVHRGTAFEERSLGLLQEHLSMSLRRVGGKSDGGIDLMGWWWLPPNDTNSATKTIPASRRRLRVLAQCKAEKKKMGPNFVREMEGVLHRYISLSAHTPTTLPSFSSNQFPLVALLISESAFTKSTILRAQSSPVPFFLLHLPPVSPDEQGWIGAAVWNPALAGTRGLLGGEMEARWERSLTGDGRPGLWWRNQKLRSWTPDSSTEIEHWDLGTEDDFIEDFARDAL